MKAIGLMKLVNYIMAVLFKETEVRLDSKTIGMDSHDTSRKALAD
jgi:hypothetical protein